MKLTAQKPGTGGKRPPAFPALTKAQKEWVATRRRELKSAIADGIDSGKADGYRAFDMERILSFIAQRQSTKPRARSKRA